MKKEDKFIITDVTDTICIGGFGNDLGNIGLLKYSEEEITNMIIENNNNKDNIRLVNSLLGTIRKQKEVIDKLKKYIEEHDYDYIYMDCKFIETEVYKKLKDILKEVE